jgi:hypothetical protein
MRSYLVLTETGPILAVTSCQSATDGRLRAALVRKGIDKFIAHEVPVDYVHRLYGVPFEVIAADLEKGKEVRVLDFNGRHIFDSVSLSRLGRSFAVEH